MTTFTLTRAARTGNNSSMGMNDTLPKRKATLAFNPTSTSGFWVGFEEAVTIIRYN